MSCGLGSLKCLCCVCEADCEKRFCKNCSRHDKNRVMTIACTNHRENAEAKAIISQME